MNIADCFKAYWCAVIDAATLLDKTADELTAEDVAVEALPNVQVPEGKTATDAYKALRRMAVAFLAYQYGEAA